MKTKTLFGIILLFAAMTFNSCRETVDEEQKVPVEEVERQVEEQ